MKYVRLPESYPIDNVSVFAVTSKARKIVARYWNDTEKWIVVEKNIDADETVVKWKYADATLTNRN